MLRLFDEFGNRHQNYIFGIDDILLGLTGISTAVGIFGDVKAASRAEPEQQFKTRPPFRGTITTPAFTLGGGTLTRTGTDAFSTGGFAKSLTGVRTNLGGLQSRIISLRPQITGGLRGAQGLFGRTDVLRGDIRGLDRDLAGLQGQVRPGFGRLFESAKTTIRNRAEQVAGNLREQLAQRKVLGSSFANAQQASIARDFAELEEQVSAQAIVQEIEATRQIVKDRAGLVELSGRLLELDQRSLVEQARFIALDLQATEQQADLFAQQVSVIQTEMQAFRDQFSRELAELGLSLDFLAVVDQIIGGSASAQVQQAASSIGTTSQSGAASEGEGGAGGPGGAGGGGGDGGGGAGGCFPAGTLVDMADGSKKAIEALRLEDETAGGRVTAIMTFETPPMFIYKGIQVSGGHAVHDNGAWTRVKDTGQATPLDADATARIEQVYCPRTSEHRIHINGVTFADYVEADARSETWDSVNRLLMAELQAQDKNKREAAR